MIDALHRDLLTRSLTALECSDGDSSETVDRLKLMTICFLEHCWRNQSLLTDSDRQFLLDNLDAYFEAGKINKADLKWEMIEIDVDGSQRVAGRVDLVAFVEGLGLTVRKQRETDA